MCFAICSDAPVTGIPTVHFSIQRVSLEMTKLVTSQLQQSILLFLPFIMSTYPTPSPITSQ